MNGLAWLNDLMVWLARWIPRITLIPATHEGVFFGPNGSVTGRPAGLTCYWPITHELRQVSTRLRTMELAAQLHGREALQVVVTWKITVPPLALMAMNDVSANLDDRVQSALAAVYAPGRPSKEIAEAMRQILFDEMLPRGVVVESVDVSQRGPVLSFKVLKDWAVHENSAL